MTHISLNVVAILYCTISKSLSELCKNKIDGMKDLEYMFHTENTVREMETGCRSYLTGSKYEGVLRRGLIMDGYGRYTFHDGSEYVGYFQNNRFHGYGCIRLAQPYKFLFRGTFRSGVLVDIVDMCFADGLRFEADVVDKNVDATKWKYCSEADRRFSGELSDGLEPVGYASYLTKWRIARKLRPGTYDVEEGIYLDATSCIFRRPPPFNHRRFVWTTDEKNWIRKNCRRATPACITEPQEDIAEYIIRTNLGYQKDATSSFNTYSTILANDNSDLKNKKDIHLKHLDSEEDQELQLTSSIESGMPEKLENKDETRRPRLIIMKRKEEEQMKLKKELNRSETTESCCAHSHSSSDSDSFGQISIEIPMEEIMNLGKKESVLKPIDPDRGTSIFQNYARPFTDENKQLTKDHIMLQNCIYIK